MDERRREKDPSHGRGGEQEPVPKVPPGDHPLGAIEKSEAEKDLVGILLEDRIVVDVLGLERQEEHRQDGGRPARDPMGDQEDQHQRSQGAEEPRQAESRFRVPEEGDREAGDDQGHRRDGRRDGSVDRTGADDHGPPGFVDVEITSPERPYPEEDARGEYRPGDDPGLEFFELRGHGFSEPGAAAQGPF